MAVRNSVIFASNLAMLLLLTRPASAANVMARTTTAAPAPSAGSGAKPNELDRLTAIAWDHQTSVASARAAWEAARAEAGLSQHWADPMAALSVMNGPTLGGPQLSLSQAVPWPGRLALAGQEADAAATAARARYLATKAHVRRDLVSALAERTYLTTATDLTRRAQVRDRAIAKVVATMYAVGKVPQSDLIRIEVRQAKLLADLTDLHRRSESNTARLTWLLGAGAVTRLPASVALPPAPRLTWTPDALVAKGQQTAPALMAARSARSEAAAHLALAGFDARYPGLEVKVFVGNDMATKMNYLGGAVGIPLPFANQARHDADSTAARQALEAATQAEAQAQLDLTERVAVLVSQLHSDDDLLALQRKALEPEADLALQTSQAAYEVGKTDLTTVLDRDADLDAVYTRTARLQADRAEAQANLEDALGTPLSEVGS